MKINPIPQGYEGSTPYLCCKDAAGLIEFYQKAYDAREIYRLNMPDGKIGHAEIQIAGGRIMLSDEFPDWGCLSPLTIGGSATTIMIYVEDVDSFAERAIAAGAKVLMPVKDQFYGDRNCKLQDPSGHLWMFGTHIEDVSPEELQKRSDACVEKGGE